MAGVVYILCALTSFACALLLYRGYRGSGWRLLFWCCLGFCGFAVNNILLFTDLIIFPQTPLVHFRTLPALLGMLVMIYGLVMEEV